MTGTGRGAAGAHRTGPSSCRAGGLLSCLSCFSWFLSSGLLCVCVAASPAAEPWSTYRGNLHRTGNTDG